MAELARLADHLWRLWPEMFGGFCGFFVHTIHHRLFKAVLGWLRHLRRG